MAASSSWITPEQYLKQERETETRSEYLNGRVLARALSNANHNMIAVNIGAELHCQFKNRPNQVYTSQMRVHIKGVGKYAYPDVSVVCGEAQFEDEEVDTLLNPTILFEILSPTTEAYDRGGKFAHYRRIPTLQEYVMVAQNQPLVEHYARHGEQWTLTEYRSFEATLELPSIQCRIPLTEIYDKVAFPPVPDAVSGSESVNEQGS